MTYRASGFGLTLRAAFFTTAMLIASLGYTAERVLLKDGMIIEGNTLSLTQGSYQFKTTTGEIRTIDKNDIEKIETIHTQAQTSTPAADQPAQVSLRLHGSNTIGAALAPALITDFLKLKGATPSELKATGPHVEHEINVTANDPTLPNTIEIHAHGSSTAFKDFAARTTDIGMSSRRIKIPQELVKLSSLGNMIDSASEHIIALDGLAIIINPANPIQSLTVEQIADIFTCNITDWSQLGGKAGAIKLYSRDNNSGTFDTFKTLVLNKQPICETAERYEDSDELSDKISNDKNGIGFIGLAYINDAKPLGIQECSIVYQPSSFSVKAEEYPLSRRLYMYTPSALRTPLIEEFTDFIQTRRGQSSVEKHGFVSLEIESAANKGGLNQSLARIRAAVTEMQSANIIKEFVSTTEGAERISVTFRFDTGSYSLDHRARTDVHRLVEYMKRPENQGKQLILIGFADSEGGYTNNLQIAKHRAHAIEKELKKIAGETLNITVKSFGEEAPVACNNSEKGKKKNRHVEVWLK